MQIRTIIMIYSFPFKHILLLLVSNEKMNYNISFSTCLLVIGLSKRFFCGYNPYPYLITKKISFLFLQYFLDRFTLPPNYILPIMPLVSKKMFHPTELIGLFQLFVRCCSWFPTVSKPKRILLPSLFPSVACLYMTKSL
jgi:hypothetical protein